MNRRIMFSLALAAAIGALTMPAASFAQEAQRPPAAAGAQQKPPAAPEAPKALKDQLVGTWRLLIADAVNPDNSQTPQFGPNPEGILIFTPNGHYSLQIMRYNRPKFAANDRTKGTADENKAAISQMASHFGTYTVDEANKTITFRIEGSAYPNWEGTTQTRMIKSINPNDALVYMIANPSTGTLPEMVAWKWVP
ncbi:MAG TPA: lipocalin-like domain-containing protein [Xanthobacteraceae bacterium]|nr:lipocalin-like domain-containing protein [Xanthobacteraceae bacterium]